MSRIFLSIVAFSSFFALNFAQAVPENAKKKAHASVLTAKLENLSDLFRYPAIVDSKVNANILAENEGSIEKVNVTVGSQVKKGQLLMVIRNTDPAYQYAPVRVTAPVSGVVSALPLTMGARVARGQQVASIIDPTQLRITAEIPSSDVSLFTGSENGEFTSVNHEEPIKIKVRGVSPFVDPKSGTAPAEIEFVSAKETTLRPGVMGQVRFELSKRQTYTLPVHAVTYREGKPFARVLENGKIKNIAIELGPRKGDTFEIKKGLTTGMTVVERLSRIVAEGEEVQVDEPEKKTN
ncbi:MAG: efflux RND transporter periplasmic adaptor subunit [Pseudobdellovibrionaceae bacterium]